MAKIALFISSLHKAGSERVAVNLAQYLHGRGHDVLLVTQRRDGDEYEYDHAIPRRLSDLTEDELGGNRLVNFVRRYRKLQKIWKRERPDVILSFIGKNNVMALLTARRYHIPVVVSVRGDPAAEYADERTRRAAFRLFPKAAGVILQTERSASFFPEAVRANCTILPNPLSESFIGLQPAETRYRTVTAVGRLDENKNQRMMIEAFAVLADEFPAYSLVIYGDGPSRAALQRLIVEKGLGARVLLPGSITDVAAALRQTSAFLLTSDTEGMPNTLLEAMATGLPCIATDCPCGGPAAVIRDGENGLLVPVRDTAALTAALRRVLSDPALAQRLGAAAANVQETYAPARVLPQWEAYLLEKCKG